MAQGVCRRGAVLPLYITAVTSFAMAANCPKAQEPLLWKATTSAGATAYILGTYALPFSVVEPLPSVVEEALGCADIAFFELACSTSKGGGLDNYFDHCKAYPISDDRDAIALRLSPQEVADVQGAVRNLLTKAPAGCTDVAAKLREVVKQLPDSNFRETLQELYLTAIRAMDPQGCELVNGNGALQSFEDALRNKLTGRPIWGLRDLNTECARHQGNTVEEDKALAGRMVAEFNDIDWLLNVTSGQKAMAEIVRCGDISRLANLKEEMVHLPWLRTRNLNQTNAILAHSIGKAVLENAGQTVLAVVELQHIAEIPGVGGLLGMLTGMDYQVQRVVGSSGCQPSAVNARPGAKELDECVVPVFQKQPESCTKLRENFTKLLGNDTDYGRVKSNDDCERCVNDTVACTCAEDWSNTTDFQKLCEETVVDGVHGQVLAMDLTRNPGSKREGRSQAAKTVRELFQHCYATTCDSQLLEEVALRQWYRHDRTLMLGQVVLHEPGVVVSYGGETRLRSGIPSPFGGGTWSWWSWLLAGLFVAISIALLLVCFRLPKRKTAKRSFGGRGRRDVSTSGSERFSGAPPGEMMYQENYEELKPLAAGLSSPATPPRMASYPQEPAVQGHQAWQQQQQYQQQQQQQQQYEPYQQQQQYIAQEQQRLQQQQQQQWQQEQQRMVSQQPMPPPGYQDSLPMCDNSLLQQAMQMEQELGEAGAQAVRNLQQSSMQEAHNSLLQGISSPGAMAGAGGSPHHHTFPPMAQPGSPFGSGLHLSMPTAAPGSPFQNMHFPGAIASGSASHHQGAVYTQAPHLMMQQPTYYAQAQPVGVPPFMPAPTGAYYGAGVPAEYRQGYSG